MSYVTVLKKYGILNPQGDNALSNDRFFICNICGKSFMDRNQEIIVCPKCSSSDIREYKHTR